MKKKRTNILANVKRTLFNFYYLRDPVAATEWLNEKLETTRIADEEMEWEPDLS